MKGLILNIACSVGMSQVYQKFITDISPIALRGGRERDGRKRRQGNRKTGDRHIERGRNLRDFRNSGADPLHPVIYLVKRSFAEKARKRTGCVEGERGRGMGWKGLVLGRWGMEEENCSVFWSIRSPVQNAD